MYEMMDRQGFKSTSRDFDEDFDSDEDTDTHLLLNNIFKDIIVHPKIIVIILIIVTPSL